MKYSLKTILTISFSLIIFISISLILISTYYSSKSSLNKQSYKIMENISTFAIDKSESYMEVAKNAAILTKNLQSNKVLNSESIDLMIKYFYEQLILNQHFSSIYYATTEGDFVMLLKNNYGFMKKYITYDKNGDRLVQKVFTDKFLEKISEELDKNDNYDPRIRPWFINAIEKNRLIWTEPYVFYTSRKRGITTAIPVLDENKRVKGVVGIDIEIDELAKFINSLKISDHGKVFILDKSSKLISMPLILDLNKSYVLDSISNYENNNPIKATYNEFLKSTNIESFNTKKFITVEIDKSVYQALFLPLKVGELEWIIGMYANEDDFLGLLKENQKRNLLLIIIVGLFAIYLSTKFSNLVYASIRNLKRRTKGLQLLNEPQTNIDKTVIKEFDELNDSFDTMKVNLKNAYIDTLYRLAVASEYKDTETAEHINRIGLYSELIAKTLNLCENDIFLLKNASAMHDIGKLGIPDRILLKPGKLTPDERLIIETHPQIGASILKNPTSKIMEAGQIISLYHHERWDGKGYPKRLKGEEIPLFARIVAIVDVFDALISKRCYKEAFSKEKTKEIIMAEKGKAFEPKIVDAFIEKYDELIEISKKYD